MTLHADRPDGFPGSGTSPSAHPSDDRSAQAIRRHGLLLGALLGAILVGLLASDRASRLDDAERRVSALAIATRGLAFHALRDAERALQLAARLEARRQDAMPADGRPTPALALADLLVEHSELRDVVLVDGEVPAIGGWTRRRAPGASPMHFDLPRRDPTGAWLLPLAVPLPGGHAGWVTGTYRLDALQDEILRLQGGSAALIAILDLDRHVLASTREPRSSVGRQIADAELARRIKDEVHAMVDRHVHPADGVARVRAHQASAYFPLVVGTGLPLHHTLLPWYVLAVLGAVGYVLYWLAFLHLRRIVRDADGRQAGLLEQNRQSSRLLSFALRSGQMGAWAMRADGSVWWSEEVPTLHGFESGSAAVSLGGMLAHLHPEDRQRVSDRLDALREDGEDVVIDYRVLADDGGVRYLSSRGARVDSAGSGILTSGVVMDVTARIEAQQRLLDVGRQFRLMFERNPLPFWVFDVETLRFLEVNEAAVASYGYSRDEFLTMTLHDIRPARDSPGLVADVAAHRAGSESKVWAHRRKDGSDIEARIHAADIDFAGRAARLVLAEDVSDRRRAERELRYRASHDLLTGLPNEETFLLRLQELVAGAQGPVDVVRVVLQRHALVGDSLGARVGDEVLLQAATRVRAVVASGVVARMQGAEFILAVPAASATTGGDALLEALSASLREPVWAADAPHYLDATFGHAVHPDDGDTAEALVRNAGLAAHDIGQHRSTDRVRYSTALAHRMSSRLAMLARLHQAIERGDFELHFQPVFSLASDEVCCYEALVRWPQADGSYIPPGEFIPLCEDSALIVPLGRWVLHEAARSWCTMAAAGLPPRPVAVNISVTQFIRSDLVAELRTVTDSYGLPPGAIELELTEGVVMSDPELVIATLAELRAMGVRLAIDDFGTGYSNMAYLRRLPVHTLKIDRVFVHDVVSDPHNAAICRSIISLARLFDMEVTAEGIESQDQFDWLRDNGAHKVQGFLLGRPAPLSTLLGTPPRLPPDPA